MSFNPFSLEGKRVIVTGASSGIGRAIAITLSKMGADILLLARDLNRLTDVYNNLEPGNHVLHSIDLTQYESIEPVISNYVTEKGKVHGFVHSAGIEMTVPLNLMKSEYYEKIFAINVISGFEAARVISKKKHMDSSGGSIVFLASIRGVLGQEAAIAYSGSKGALIAGAKTMSLELAPKNIRVNCISPSIVETEMTKNLFANIPEESKNKIISSHPLGLGKTEDVANACVYLISDASKWITGSNLIIDGGYSAR